MSAIQVKLLKVCINFRFKEPTNIIILQQSDMKRKFLIKFAKSFHKNFTLWFSMGTLLMISLKQTQTTKMFVFFTIKALTVNLNHVNSDK